VDKTPGSLWVMELSGRIFGFSQWSMLAPQALEGVGSVLLLYAAVKRWFGPAAGLIAGLVLALTPAAALMFRFNNPDALLVLLMTTAAYTLVRAVENGRTRWLVFTGLLIGFAFLANTSPNFMTRISNAGKLLWPILLDETAAPDRSPSPSSATASPTAVPPPPEGLPAVGDVIARMVAAHGGEESLRRHRSMEVHAQKSYANQGAEAELLVLAEAPDRRTEEETWTAAGTPIGRVRVFFDGTRGGQETTFGQDETYGDEDNDRAGREATLHPVLDVAKTYTDVRMRGPGRIDAEDTYVLELKPFRGGPVTWHVSRGTGRLLQTEGDGKITTFTDYRAVDGELVAYRTTTQEPLGEVVVDVEQVRFNVDLPAGAFGPRRPATDR
jgi:hypothetical protein